MVAEDIYCRIELWCPGTIGSTCWQFTDVSVDGVASKSNPESKDRSHQTPNAWALRDGKWNDYTAVNSDFIIKRIIYCV